MQRDLTSRFAGRWVVVLLMDALSLGILGCGPRLVDPGPSTTFVPTPAPVPAPALPAVNHPPGGLPTLEAPEVEQIPTESVFQLPIESRADTYHPVQAGETLASVAKKYGVSVEKLRSANGLDASSKLTPQQMLFIPKGR